MTSVHAYADALQEAAPAVPEGLESPESKLVYLYLVVSGARTVDELNDDLGMTKLSLFPVLEGLAEQGLVAREGEAYVSVSS